MEDLPCDVLLIIADNLGPGDYVHLSQVSKNIQKCLDTGKYEPGEVDMIKSRLAQLRQEFGIYYIPTEYTGGSYNILDLYKSVEYGLNTEEEFKNFVIKIPIQDLIVDNEGTSLLDFVYLAEDILGSYEPLNSGQIVIVFSYPEKRVKYVPRRQYYSPENLGLWAK